MKVPQLNGPFVSRRRATLSSGTRDTFTGKSMDRPGWGKLSAAIRARNVGKVVWRLDRLGRTAKVLTARFEELAEGKVNLISLRDGIDLHTAAGWLTANVLALVAQYETEVRAERVRAGQQAARKRGVTWGGSKPGWRWKVSDDEAAAIIEMRKVGKRITQIARVTGLSRPTVYRLLNAAQQPSASHDESPPPWFR